jgi:hypothetical protein
MSDPAADTRTIERYPIANIDGRPIAFYATKEARSAIGQGYHGLRFGR